MGSLFSCLLLLGLERGGAAEAGTPRQIPPRPPVELSEPATENRYCRDFRMEHFTTTSVLFFRLIQSDISHSASVSFGFPSSNNGLSLQTKKATTMRNKPDTTMRLSMDTLSANGPKISIPTGIISVATIV